MKPNALIRPAWTPATIALMIIGFMLWWPLGLAMLAFILWGDRLEAFRTDVNGATDRVFAGCRRAARAAAAPSTGNVAFDAWRDEELKRLAEERRKLDEMRSEFDSHMRELRMARDKDEFDSFMAARRERKTVEHEKTEKGGDLPGGAYAS
ncbi:DUF2852 domain-containing protein [Notoacmeibacter sp. MSK16QG-6]|uniref:DUF2852 domain-containing protein n=1 Tax=Notoacmeibacter sp. MSK16QG-6 TaxID=2957982 RepID=UPI00209FBBEF|nr:DUF2852 domain-containing protein [Notoacmeibacter sp. MSK16QG-6]MCP1198986.1 DUF2852 domain-containing protein [Notoacmeibacter sp. MSK16QG-6]